MFGKIINNLDAQSGELEFKFTYFLDKKSPVKGMIAPMSYHCSFEGRIEEVLQIYSRCRSSCDNFVPLFKEISDNGAHNQRALIKVKISYDESEQVWLGGFNRID
ncbi:MAG: GTP cyclohydrolase, FolE2/MptA family [Candidatus Gastranaerophilaceae bacterium]